MEPITIPFTPTRAEAVEARRVLFAAPGTPPADPMLPRRIQGPRRNHTHAAIGWVLFAVLAAVLFVLLRYTTPSSPRRMAPLLLKDSSSARLLIGFSALSCGFGLFALGVVMLKRLAHNPQRAKDVSFTFTDDGVTELRPGRRYWSGWGEFHSFAETENLLVLRLTEQSAMYFPKRLFPGEQQVAAVRELFVRMFVAPAVPAATAPPESISSPE